MAGSPKWKVYRNGEYIASCKYADDAAALVSLGGGIVKHDHSLVVWNEGAESFSAGESYDGAAKIMQDRVRASIIRSIVKAYGVERAWELGVTHEEIAAICANSAA